MLSEYKQIGQIMILRIKLSKTVNNTTIVWLIYANFLYLTIFDICCYGHIDF